MRIRRNWWRLLISALCPLLVLQPAWGQQGAAQAGLKITIVDGAAARNVVQQIAARPLTVRIDDAANRPVAGAVVVFTSPQVGPSGTFTNDTRTLRVTTDQDGIASTGTYHPNAIVGPYLIQVRADFQSQTVAATIAQTNIALKRGHGKLIAILAISGAAAGAAVASRTTGANKTTVTAPTITFGGAAVGAP